MYLATDDDSVLSNVSPFRSIENDDISVLVNETRHIDNLACLFVYDGDVKFLLIVARPLRKFGVYFNIVIAHSSCLILDVFPFKVVWEALSVGQIDKLVIWLRSWVVIQTNSDCHVSSHFKTSFVRFEEHVELASYTGRRVLHLVIKLVKLERRASVLIQEHVLAISTPIVAVAIMIANEVRGIRISLPQRLRIDWNVKILDEKVFIQINSRISTWIDYRYRNGVRVDCLVQPKVPTGNS